MGNLYEVTYKTSTKARKVFTAIRCAHSDGDPALQPEGCILLSVRYIGEYCGAWCQL